MIGWLKGKRMTPEDIGDHRVAETISELRQARAAGEDYRKAVKEDRREQTGTALEATGLAGAMDDINRSRWGQRHGRRH